jgi:hypothetical protein
MTFEQASQEELVATADLVVSVLEKAGIRSTFSPGPGAESMAYLLIDDDDDGRGVYLTWQLSEAETATPRGDDDPAILRAGRAKSAAVNRLQQILRTAGIEAEETDPDFHPYYLEVLSISGADAA